MQLIVDGTLVLKGEPGLGRGRGTLLSKLGNFIQAFSHKCGLSFFVKVILLAAHPKHCLKVGAQESSQIFFDAFRGKPE